MQVEWLKARVAGLFPNEASLLRRVPTVLAEIGKEWETRKIYLGTEAMPEWPTFTNLQTNSLRCRVVWT
jgi:hypothetical protein